MEEQRFGMTDQVASGDVTLKERVKLSLQDCLYSIIEARSNLYKLCFIQILLYIHADIAMASVKLVHVISY